MLKAYLTTIGERTTDVCKWQLERLGFEVVLLDKIETWGEKYRRFINTADEDCIRIDADIIPNQNLGKLLNELWHWDKYLMVQFTTYCFYRNNIWATSPVLYKKQALDIIKTNIDKIGNNRPETEAWRLPKIIGKTYWSDMVVGTHGFGQDDKTFERARANKIERSQIKDYDFELAEKLRNL